MEDLGCLGHTKPHILFMLLISHIFYFPFMMNVKFKKVLIWVIELFEITLI